MIKKMSNEEFCKMVTAYDGEEVDSIKQIAFKGFNGEELKEFVEHCIELKNNGALGYVRNSEAKLCEDCGKYHARICDSCACEAYGMQP